MSKKLTKIEDLLKDLNYTKDSEGNLILNSESVKNIDFNERGLVINERYSIDSYPNIRSKDYLQFNNLYNTGFFDGYFSRQYHLLKDLYGLRPDNFPKPVALITDDSNRKTGYLYESFNGNEVRPDLPKLVSLQDYIINYQNWDEKLVSDKLRRVTSLQDLIPREELNKFILKHGITKLADGEKFMKEYSARIDVYKKRKEELGKVRNQINETLQYINKQGLSHNNLYFDNIIIYWNEQRDVKVGFINQINKQDVNPNYPSDQKRIKNINRGILLEEKREQSLIDRYKRKYHKFYP